MRTFSIAVVAVLGLAIGATLLNRPAATALAAGDDVHQPSIMIDQLTANAKNLPVQSFDTF
jgi:formate-dependent phosphoribosylglycinamide formyltransferase (GAR transformylase)